MTANAKEVVYRICPYRSRAQIEAGARIEAGGQEDKSLIEAGSRIEAGPEQEFAVNRSRTVIDTPLDRHVCVLSWLVTCLEDALFSWIVELHSPSNRVSSKLIRQQARSLFSAKDFHVSTGY